MKTSRFSNRSGAVLLFALLLLVVGGTILGGVAQLAVTQAVAGQTEWDSAARRIRLENSRALARQYILSQMWRVFGRLPTATLATSATGGLGGFEITSVEPPNGFWLSLDQTGTIRVNPFNLFERGGFQSAWVSGSLSAGGADQVSWGFQVRTRSPIVAGFVFVNQMPAANDSTSALRIDMRQPDYAVGFTGLPRMPVSSVSGAGGGDTSGFLGYLSAPRGEARFGDFLAAVAAIEPVVTADGSAYVELDLSTYNYYNPDGGLFYEVPPSVDQPLEGRFNIPVTKLVLKGGSENAGPPVQVLVPEFNTTLTTIELSGDNTRPVYVFQRGVGNNLTITSAGGGISFRIGMTLHSPAQLSPAGSLTIVGGLRTDRILGNAGSVTFAAEGSPGWSYEAIADRMMWLEDQRAR